MIDQTVAGRYRMEAELGADPVTTTWRAADTVLNRTVTLKILHSRLANDQGLRARFIQAMKASAGFVHPNVVAVFDTGEHDGVPFIVVEYLGGGSLRDRIANGRLPPGQVARVGAEIASGLAYAHDKGVVHGYVTPENIRFSEKEVAKLGDFGLALASIPSGTSATSGLLSTTAYLAPEQVTGDRSDARIDTYALGAVLFEAVTGGPPFKGESELAAATARLESDPPKPSEVRRGTPRELEEVIIRALARNPADRFPHAAEMRDQLASLADVAPRPSAPAKRAPRKKSQVSFLRSEGRWLLQALLIVIAAAAIVYAVITISRGRAPGLPQLGGSEVEAIAPRGTGIYDPEGTLEAPRAARVAPLATDGDLQTAWTSVNYKTENFGEEKEGVGIWFDLGEATELDRIEVTASTPGYGATIRSSDDAANWSASGPAVEAADATEEFRPTGSHRYWMVWITRLVRTDRDPALPFSVGIFEVDFFARPT